MTIGAGHVLHSPPGVIPEWLGELGGLERLYLWGNNFRGKLVRTVSSQVRTWPCGGVY